MPPSESSENVSEIRAVPTGPRALSAVSTAGFARTESGGSLEGGRRGAPR
jgi:hypothetical protein